MGFRKVNEQHELSGFFMREVGNTCQGYMRKLVDKKDGPFFVIELTAECKVNVMDMKTKKVKPGVAVPTQFIGVSAVKTLEPVRGFVDKEVRLTFTGTTPSKQFKGKEVQLFDIEVND